MKKQIILTKDEQSPDGRINLTLHKNKIKWHVDSLTQQEAMQLGKLLIDMSNGDVQEMHLTLSETPEPDIK